MTRRYVVRALLLTFVIVLAIPALAQGQGQGKDKWDSYYDTFSETWLDPAKWIPGAPNATPASILECIRESRTGAYGWKLETSEIRLQTLGFSTPITTCVSPIRMRSTA